MRSSKIKLFFTFFGIFYLFFVLIFHSEQPKLKRRVRPDAAVFMAAALEYLIAESVELAGNVSTEAKLKTIMPRHIMLATRNDAELNALLKKNTIPWSGMVPMSVPLETKSQKKQRCDDNNNDNDDEKVEKKMQQEEN